MTGTAHARTVADAMITRPHLHPATLTVAGARAALEDSHVHLLLLVEDDVLRGTVTRDDLDRATDRAPDGAPDGPGAPVADGPVLPLARLEGRTVPAGAPLEQVQREMAAVGTRRRAVIDADGRLVGLLCLKRSGTGFCSDGGVAARARDRGA